MSTRWSTSHAISGEGHGPATAQVSDRLSVVTPAATATMARTTYTIRYEGITIQTTDAATAEQESKHGATVTASTVDR